MSELIFRYGTMSSGKSLHLLSTAHNFEENNIKYQLLKPSIDNRTINTIHSRIGVEKASTAINPNQSIYEVADLSVDWLLVDEAQFLSTTQIEQLASIVDTYNINVVCYGLRTDYLTRLFDGSKRLFELADKLEELPSYCNCGNKTSVNAKIDKNGNIQYSDDGNQIEIGGNKRYKSVCRHCFFNGNV